MLKLREGHGNVRAPIVRGAGDTQIYACDFRSDGGDAVGKVGVEGGIYRYRRSLSDEYFKGAIPFFTL